MDEKTWLRASLLVLSCPTPVRRHTASLLPADRLVLPQVFLGGEAQLLAFVAAAPASARKNMMFAPLPEMFAGRASLPHAGDAAHLRFGSVRESRVLKGVPNAAVVAECESPPPLTASQHPFASGQLLPAAMDAIFAYPGASLRPHRIGGAELPAFLLPPACCDADLAAAPRPAGKAGGLDVVALAAFDAEQWAAGRVPALPARTLAQGDAVLLPWNVAHPGSIIPLLLERLAGLWQNAFEMPGLVLLPFNDPGQTGALGALVKRLSKACANPPALLAKIFLARVTHLRGLGRLKKIGGTAWVDGNDPEHAWTAGRLAVFGIDPLLIDPGAQGLPDVRRIAADEPVWVECHTVYGPLRHAVRLPSLRALPALLACAR